VKVNRYSFAMVMEIASYMSFVYCRCYYVTKTNDLIYLVLLEKTESYFIDQIFFLI